MDTTLERTAEHTVKLTIEVPADEYAQEMERTYRDIASEVKIPGFRKGKAPRRIIDAQVGRETVRDEFIRSALPVYYRQAVTDEDLAPIADPDIDLEEFADDAPLVFTATVEVRPRLELTEEDYTGLPVTRPSTEVTDEEIDAWIDRLRERFSELEPAERPVREGDFVTIDVHATVAGDEVEGLSRTDYLYFVSSGEFGPTLDAQLPGTKPGDILNVTEELGPGAGEGLAGQGADLRVLIKDVKARKLPEADDELARTASEFDTLEELREDVRTRLGENKEREADGAVRDRALSVLVDRHEVDLPESLVEDETRHRIESATRQAERSGMTLEQMLAAQGWDRERLEQDSRDHAIRAIRADLVLEGVSRAAELEVTADEIGAEVAALAQAYDRDPKELVQSLERSGQIVSLAGDIIRGKALDLIVDRADIEPEGEAAPGPGAEPETEATEEPEPESESEASSPKETEEP
jgi:trigger factor